MSREKLADFLASSKKYQGTNTPTSISYAMGDDNGNSELDIGDDLGIDPGSGKDLLEISDESGGGPSLINDFLKYLTDASNYYTIKGNAQAAQPLSHLDDGGGAVVLKPAEDTGAKNVFVKTGESSGDGLGGTMSQYSNSPYFEGQDLNLRDIVSKYGDIRPEDDLGAGPHSGNKLLSIIEGQDLNKTGKTFVQTHSPSDLEQNSLKAVQQVLLTRNRFNTNDDIGFDPVDSTVEDLQSGTDGVGTRTAQSSFGEYDPDSPVMINEDLANVALSMMLKALGVDSSVSPGGEGGSKNPNEFDYEGGEIDSVASDPSIVKSQAKATARARNAFGGPQDSTGASPFAGGGAFETDGQASTYGSDFTPDLEYSKSSSSAVIKSRTAAAILAMMYTGSEIGKMVDSIDGDKIDLGRGPYYLGQAKKLAVDSKLQLFQRLIIPYTRFPYIDCLNQGARILFGRDFSESDPNTSQKEDVASYQTVAESPGFWYSVARSALKRFNSATTRIANNQQSFTSDPASALPEMMAAIGESGIIGIIRTLIQIGDISLYATGGNTDMADAITDGVRPFNVDLLPDGPATRISKSRSQNGQTSAALAWRNSSVPGMYLLPRNVIKAAVDMNNFTMGGNPVKGHTTNDLIMKTYINVNSEGQSSRIPADVVQKMENTLDAEYVPFYFHDVRTNEIISFHAFLSNMQDSYQASFSSEGGYGRVDKVKIYKDTTRSLTLGFHVVATSKEDFDEMWFKINKLVTLVYPQWTKGTVMKDTVGNSFVQPFSQTIGATPLVRLRVGDVIKSNYSRFNLARMFGIGEPEFETSSGFFSSALGSSGAVSMGQTKMNLSDIQIDTVFKLAFGSPMALVGSGDAGATVGDRIMRSLLSSTATLNGFVNPIGAGLVLRQLRSPDTAEIANTVPATINPVIQTLADIANGVTSGLMTTNLVGDDLPGYLKGAAGDYPILKPSIDVGYRVEDDSVPGGVTRFRTTVPYRVTITNKAYVPASGIGTIHDANSSYTSKGFRDPNRVAKKLQYTVQIFDSDGPKGMDGKNIKVWHEDLMPNPELMFMKNVSPYLDAIGSVAGATQLLLNEASKLAGIPADSAVLLTTDAAEFMHPANNVITRAFENSGGRGLAGVIRSMSFQWADATQTWETEWNARAPKFCKVDIGFDVIHDLPPGVDSSGYNRAPVYNVGTTMHSIVGDVQADGGKASQQAYTRAGVAANQALNKDLDE